ncbi:MAG: EndoU domain-containing protein [Myxococcota bacterium]
MWRPLSLALCLLLLPIPARANTSITGSFRAAEECPAGRSIKTLDKSEVRLTKGAVYRAVARNKPGGKFLLIVIPGAKPEKRWVADHCGTLEAAPAAAPPAPGASPPPAADPGAPEAPPAPEPPKRKFSVFFDTVDDGPKDMTPKPPELTPLDQKILALCGPLGSSVSRHDFGELLKHEPELRTRLKAVLPVDDVVAGASELWFARKGFEHVFCGQIKSPTEIAGLHWIGRYLDLQTKDLGGRLLKNKKEALSKGLVYTVGIQAATETGTVEDPVKGYAYGYDAATLLLEGTRAASAYPRAKGCLVTTHSPAGDVQQMLVLDHGALVTLYPVIKSREETCN